ncbi:MAG: small subunit ribosomal protein [Chloroflexia bacterium]|nr:small subunit ribosomal protein [Chloroflexia bacterium]
MANTKSALKRIRSGERKRARNKPVRTALKTFVRSAVTQINTGVAEDSAEAVVRAISALDKAAGKGIIHKNQAARRKSRLMSKLNRLNAAG